MWIKFDENICIVLIFGVYLHYKQLTITTMTTLAANEIKSNVYEIKVNRKWRKVRATSMIALSEWAKLNNVSDFRMVGMMSNSEIRESQKLEVVS